MPTQEQIVNAINNGQLSWVQFFLDTKKNDPEAEFKVVDYDFSNRDFTNWLWGGISFDNVNFENSLFRNSRITGTFFSRCNLKNTDFENSNLSYYESGGHKLVTPASNFIVECDFSYSNFNSTDFRGCVLNACNFQNCNLSNSNLSETLLAYADGRAVNFRNTILKGAILPIVKTESKTIGRFTDLAIVEGLETAVFDSDTLLTDYIADVFTLIHNEELPKYSPNEEYSGVLLNRIKAIELLYSESNQIQVIQPEILELKQEILMHLKNHPEFLKNFKGRIFEELVAELLSSYGWDVDLTKKTRDGGYDIFAISKDVSGLKSSWIVECKGWKNTVGIDVVRALYGVKADLKIGNALLATTSQFSQDIHNYKASRYDLELKDFHGLIEWINEYKPRVDGKLYVYDDKIKSK